MDGRIHLANCSRLRRFAQVVSYVVAPGYSRLVLELALSPVSELLLRWSDRCVGRCPEDIDDELQFRLVPSGVHLLTHVPPLTDNHDRSDNERRREYGIVLRGL